MHSELIATTLSNETLNRLCLGEIAVVWLKKFYPIALCKHAIENILKSDAITYYSESPDFKRIGQPYSLAYEDHAEGMPHSVNHYFANSIKMTTHMRQLFQPYYSPLDDLRLKLDEAWPGGACLKTVNQQKYQAGVIRIMQTREVDIPPHFDRYLPLYPDFDKTPAKQLSANIYLDMPVEQGGELKLWLKSSNQPIPVEQASKLAIFNAGEIGSPAIIIKPEQGDLVLFNPCLLHAVAGGIMGSRISLGLFMGINNENEPIEYWS